MGITKLEIYKIYDEGRNGYSLKKFQMVNGELEPTELDPNLSQKAMHIEILRRELQDKGLDLARPGDEPNVVEIWM